MRTRTNKKGSYLVEAVLALPVFIIAVMVMSSVILMYACIEDCNFIMASELRRTAAEAIAADTSAAAPLRIKKEICSRHSQIESARVTDAGLRVSRWGTDELIMLKLRLRLSSPDPIGINAAAHYDLSCVTRAYVGRERDEGNMTAAEFADENAHPVFIFPKRGEKYHSKGCRFLTAATTTASLTAAVRSRYRSCPLCRSSRAGDGTLIYYFPAAGDDYHLPGCPALERNFIEVDREVAIERGYTPCAICGG